MKTFNEKDLITWSSRDKAVIGDEYYFSDTIDILNDKIKRNDTSPLAGIKNGTIWHPFINNNGIAYTCILPINKVIGEEPEKKYRACKTIKELYEVVNNYRSDSFPNNELTNENFIYNLLNSDIHVRSKNTGTEYYSSIRSVSKKDTADIRILFSGKSYLSFEQIFENYEIELNGEWQPFGVLDDN